MRNLVLVAALATMALPGCTEEENEFWWGVPKLTESKVLAVSESDSNEAKEYKAKAWAARQEIYPKLSTKTGRRIFTEKADQFDFQTINDILWGRSRAYIPNMNMDRDDGPMYEPPRQYNPMEFQAGRNADMYRLGQSMQNAGNSAMATAFKQERDKGEKEALPALYDYFGRMDTLKRKLVRGR